MQLKVSCDDDDVVVVFFCFLLMTSKNKTTKWNGARNIYFLFVVFGISTCILLERDSDDVHDDDDGDADDDTVRNWKVRPAFCPHWMMLYDQPPYYDFH